VGEGLKSRRRLVIVCAVAAIAETVLVDRFAAPSTLGLATQVSAPPPFGVFHDLRWILVYHESWLGFALELLAFVAFRGAMTTVCLRCAWPSDVAPEPLAVSIRRSVVFTVVAGLLLAPWAALLFALAVVSLSWLFFVAVPVVLLLDNGYSIRTPKQVRVQIQIQYEENGITAAAATAPAAPAEPGLGASCPAHEQPAAAATRSAAAAKVTRDDGSSAVRRDCIPRSPRRPRPR